MGVVGWGWGGVPMQQGASSAFLGAQHTWQLRMWTPSCWGHLSKDELVALLWPQNKHQHQVEFKAVAVIWGYESAAAICYLYMYDMTLNVHV